MTEPLKIQLAIQGGGAKICTLMATMEKIQELEQEGLIKVTRIAGTSAGSIVGCLFAAGIPMETIKAYIVGGAGKELAQQFSQPTTTQMLVKVLRSKTFWNYSLLEERLKKLFKDKGVFYLGDFYKKTGTRVSVLAADLGNAKTKVYNDSDTIVSAIMNSCGLPYYLRGWNKVGNDVLVDGGICENLPSEILHPYVDNDGPIVAISFEPSIPGTPQNFKSFTLALLETAMNNSIDRAKKSLKPGSIFTIRTDIRTFDFEMALHDGLGAHYNEVKLEAEKFFNKFVADQRREQNNIERSKIKKRGDNDDLKRQEEDAIEALKKEKLSDTIPDYWSSKNLPTNRLMEQLGRVYEAQHATSKFTYLRCSFSVQANCLLQENEVGYGNPDILIYSGTFQTSNEPLYCMSVALTQAEEEKYLGRTQWRVLDANRKQIETIAVPIHNPDSLEDKELLLFFNPVLPSNSGPYSLVFTDEAIGIMKPLLAIGKDELAFFPRRALGNVGRIDLLLHVPKRAQNVRMVNKSGSFQGRQMTEDELAAYSLAPFGFYTLGWTGDNLHVNDSFGVDIYRT